MIVPRRTSPNKRSAGNGGTALLCHAERPRPAVPDRECSGHGHAPLAISAASAISAREKRNAQRRRERRGPAVSIESAMDGESAPTTHAPNKAAPVNAPVAFWFHAGRAWRRVTEQRRWRRIEVGVGVGIGIGIERKCHGIRS